MADVALAKRTVQIYEGALSTAQQDLTAQQNIQTSFQNKANALNDKAAGLPNGSDEQQATLEKAANYQSQANNQAQFITRAQDNVANAQSQVDYAKQELVTAQQQQDKASSQTATDAVADKTTNPAPATQNTGTDSSETGTAPTPTEQAQVASGNKQTADVVAGVAPKSVTAPLSVSAPISSVANPADSALEAATVTQDVPPTYSDKLHNLTVPWRLIANPLANYASYTYGVQLHVLTSADYKHMVDNPNDIRVSKNLISTGNRYNITDRGQGDGGTYRDPAFKDDFYINGLKLKTVIGLNATSRATNAIDISFTITEPYGMTFLNRLLDINNDELDGTNYLDMPYLLEINFFGDNGEGDDNFGGGFGIIDSETKFIPIKIIGLKIKSGVKGTEYEVQAVPFNHQANLESIQATQANFEITARTIADYFANDKADDALTESVNAGIQKNKEDEARATSPRPVMQNDPRLTTNDPANTNTGYEMDQQGNVVEPGVRSPDQANSKGATPTPTTVKTKSFVSAYNAWNKAQKLIAYDKIRIEIDPLILAAGNLVEPKKASAQSTPTTESSKDAANANNADKNSKTPANNLDFTAQLFAINAGSNINDIINNVMMNTDYIKKQLNDPETQPKDGKTKTADPQEMADNKKQQISWFKIIPEVKLDVYDKDRNTWGKTITYYIKHWYYYNSKDPRATQTPPPLPVKEYQYIYTGHNTDIIEFDIDFNTLYYTAIQVNKGLTSSLNKSAKTDEASTKTTLNPQDSKLPQPVKTNVQGQNQGSTVSGAHEKSDTVNAHSVMQSFYSNSAGDALSLKLKILGDPTFIKQDDIRYNPGNTGWETDTINLPGNSSINMETGQIFCNVIFKTPVDFNDETGFYLDTNSKYRESYFGGYYHVLTVESEFNNGKFTQTLDLIRQENQPKDYAQSGAPDSNFFRNEILGLPKSADPKVAGSTVEDKTASDPLPSETNANNTVKTTVDDDASSAGGAAPAVIPAGENQTTDAGLANVAENGETKTMDQATSADGNTTPVQSTGLG
jgi:hypothetical protein